MEINAARAKACQSICLNQLSTQACRQSGWCPASVSLLRDAATAVGPAAQQSPPGCGGADAGRFGGIDLAIGDTLAGVELSATNGGHCEARVDTWDLNQVQIMKLHASGLAFSRPRSQCGGPDRHLLVMMPAMGTMEFSQCGRTVHCSPGSFLMQSSEEPFSFQGDGALWIVRISADRLKARVGNPLRLIGRSHDATQGIGRLFSDYLQMTVTHASAHYADNVLSVMAAQLIDLLAACLHQEPETLQHMQTGVREAHLARIEAYILDHLYEPELSPGGIAAACHISLRYLHLLFKSTGESVSQRIREMRLQAAHELLSSTTKPASVAQVAYTVGFNDHAQFSHAFRKKFGHTPSDMRRRTVGSRTV